MKFLAIDPNSPTEERKWHVEMSETEAQCVFAGQMQILTHHLPIHLAQLAALMLSCAKSEAEIRESFISINETMPKEIYQFALNFRLAHVTLNPTKVAVENCKELSKRIRQAHT